MYRNDKTAGHRCSSLKEHAATISVPFFKQMKVDRDPDEKTVFNAGSRLYFEQFICCGPCLNEGFDDRNIEDLEELKKTLASESCTDAEESVHFFKTYSNGTFTFDIYAVDVVLASGDATSRAKVLYAFFHEPRFNDRYMISFGKLLNGPIEGSDDAVLNECENYLKVILDGVRYR